MAAVSRRFVTAPPSLARVGVNRVARRGGRAVSISQRAIVDRLDEPGPHVSVANDVPPRDGDPTHPAGETCPVNRVAIWQTMCKEARADAETEPALASYLFSTVLAHRSLEDALAFVLANKLRSNVLLDSQLLQLFAAAYRKDASLVREVPPDSSIFQRVPGGTSAPGIACAVERKPRALGAAATKPDIGSVPRGHPPGRRDRGRRDA
jgi:hypothetical protein